MLKKSALVVASTILLACGTLLLNADAARSSVSEPALGTRPMLNCQPMGELLLGQTYRGFSFQRDGKDLVYTFRYRPEDDVLGVTRWELIPLHPTNRAKKGDLRFTWGTDCQSLKAPEDQSYDPKKTERLKRSPIKSPVAMSTNGAPYIAGWNFDGRLRSVRDEVDALALIGFNAKGNRVVFHWRVAQYGPRRGGTILGKLEGLACRVSVVGLPIAQGIYVVSRKALEALSLLEIPGADKANLTLEGFAIYAGVTSDGRVTGRFGIRFDGNPSDTQKARQYGELAVKTLIGELTGNSVPTKVTIRNPKFVLIEGRWYVDALIYLDDWMSAIDALAETVDATDLDLCKVFD
jgi:hypothetical protein